MVVAGRIVAAAPAAAAVVAAAVVVATVLAAATGALDLECQPGAAGPLHPRLDVAHAGPQAAQAGDALEARAGVDLDADRAALGVAQAERAVGAVDGHDGALELAGGGRS